MIYCVYRCLYGEDFIQSSIDSIKDFVDKIIIFWTDIPLGNVKTVKYLGSTINFPNKFDNIIEKIKELNCNKVDLIYYRVENNDNQFTNMVNNVLLKNYNKPDYILFMEPDMVYKKNNLYESFREFENKNILTASTKQIEIWRTFKYRVPERKRPCSIYWNLKNIDKIPDSGKSANHPDMQYLESFVHNFGFCMSEKNMYWKHLLAMAFSSIINDSQPNELWYENKWLKWDPKQNNNNLEISIGFEHCIPAIEKYNIDLLPETILDRIESFECYKIINKWD